MTDENENTITFQNLEENHSEEDSKNSDKENSNIRNNQDLKKKDNVTPLARK